MGFPIIKESTFSIIAKSWRKIGSKNRVSGEMQSISNFSWFWPSINFSITVFASGVKGVVSKHPNLRSSGYKFFVGGSFYG